MVKESYVSLVTAKLLKEKEFDGDCDWYYPKEGGEIKQLDLYELNYCRESFIKAPSQSLAMRWLRDIHKICILITHSMREPKYGFEILPDCDSDKIHFDKEYFGFDYNSYEEATEEAIKYCLENLIK